LLAKTFAAKAAPTGGDVMDNVKLAECHSRNLRKGRHSETGFAYLLTAVTDKRRLLFTQYPLGRLLVAELRSAEASGLVQSLAWVVMPEHFHWLITLQSGTLSALMQRVKGRSGRTRRDLAKRILRSRFA